MDISRHFEKAPFLFRIWYYLRVGYGTYLSFVLGFFNTAVLGYYLLIGNITFLKEIFPFFTLFLITIFLMLLISSVLFGWIHFQRIPAFKAEMDISAETNPYFYKPTPGITKELNIPLNCYLIKVIETILDDSGKITDKDRRSLKELFDKFEMLYKGGSL